MSFVFYTSILTVILAIALFRYAAKFVQLPEKTTTSVDSTFSCGHDGCSINAEADNFCEELFFGRAAAWDANYNRQYDTKSRTSKKPPFSYVLERVWRPVTFWSATFFFATLTISLLSQVTYHLVLGDSNQSPICSSGEMLVDGECVEETYNITYPLDVCINIPGHQTAAPKGKSLDGKGNCLIPTPSTEKDFCSNIPGLQPVVPNGMILRSVGNCVQYPCTTGFTAVSTADGLYVKCEPDVVVIPPSPIDAHACPPDALVGLNGECKPVGPMADLVPPGPPTY